jgi:nicotinamidase-related amidase
MVAHKINPQKTALLVFDMINEFIKPGFGGYTPGIRENLVPRLKKLIEHCRSKDIPVIYACHVHREDGSDFGLLPEILRGLKERKRFISGTESPEVYEEIKPQEGDIVVEKRRFSAFYGTDLELILRGMGKDTLIITGFATNIGCESTARDAVDMDFRVIFPSDGNGVRDLPDMGWGPIPGEEIQRVFLSTLARSFARVLTIDELISELQ